MQQLFVELIRVATGHQEKLSHTPSADEWGMLYKAAQKQAVVGVAFRAVKRLPQEQMSALPARQLMEWLALTAQIQARNEQVCRRCLELQQMLSGHGLASCILKGQGVAAFYPDGLGVLRQSGDIDVWAQAPRNEVIDFVMQHAPTRKFDEKHAHFRVFNDVEVELHWIPVKWENPFRNRVLEAYFEKEKHRQFTHRMAGLCVPTTDFQLVHQLLHVYAHYVYEGVGLRQLMDLFFTQQTFVQSMPEKAHEVYSLFKKVRLTKFVAATQYVLQRFFGMGDDGLLCRPDEQEGILLWEEMAIGGNFGQHDVRNNVRNESFCNRALRRHKRKWRMVRFDPLGTFVMPFSRLKLELWMRMVRKKYGV